MALNKITNRALNRWMRHALPIYFSIVFILTIIGAFDQVQSKNTWSVGDWLINYQGGFIRRGLLGEALFWIGSVINIHPSYLVFVVYFLCYGGFFFFAFRLLRLQNNLLPYFFLLISPAIFLFQIHEYQGGFRKEILLFALFAFLVYLGQSASQKKFKTWFYVILFTFPALILSHEMLAVWLPYLPILFLLNVKLKPLDMGLIALGLSFNVVALWLCVQNGGDMITAAQISLSLSPNGAPWLGGAIRALAQDIPRAYASVQNSIMTSSYFSIYAFVGIMTLLAFIPIRTRLLDIFKKPLVFVLLTSSILGTIALALIATDWGRLIYIHVVIWVLLALTVNPEYENAKKNRAIGTGRLTILAILAVVYAGTWFLPHHGIDEKTLWPNHLVLNYLEANKPIQPE